MGSGLRGVVRSAERTDKPVKKRAMMSVQVMKKMLRLQLAYGA